MESQARKNPKTIVTIPDDLVKEEILPRLPVKSLLRFKSVSKQWRSLIISSYFLKKHMVSRPSNPKFVVLREHKRKSPTFAIETFSRDDQSQNPTKKGCFTWFDLVSQIIRRAITFIEVVGSCDGLVVVCFSEIRDKMRVFIINPATRKQREIHRPQVEGPLQDFCGLTGFGKDIVTGTYKVVFLHDYRNSNIFMTKVSTLDKSCTQRNIGIFPVPLGERSSKQTSVYANGSVFWLTQPVFGSSSIKPVKIVALDLHTEKFRRVSWPSWYVKYSQYMRLWSLKDGLCLSDVRAQYPDVDVWSLKMEDSTEKWEKTLSINVSSISQLDSKFWRLGLEAAYARLRKDVNDEDHVLLARWRSSLYTETLLSPYLDF